jgi:hypothetical protein
VLNPITRNGILATLKLKLNESQSIVKETLEISAKFEPPP